MAAFPYLHVLKSCGTTKGVKLEQGIVHSCGFKEHAVLLKHVVLELLLEDFGRGCRVDDFELLHKEQPSSLSTSQSGMKKGVLHGIKKMCLAVEAVGRFALDLAQEVEEGDAVQENLENLGAGISADHLGGVER